MAAKRYISNVFVDNADDLLRLKRGKRRRRAFGSSGGYWTPQTDAVVMAKLLYWGKTSEISGGQMPNKVTGSTDYITVVGSAGNETYQLPNTAPYVAADIDYLWFKWLTGLVVVFNQGLTSGVNYSVRNIIAANTSTNSGTKIRISFKSTGGNAVINGASIGVMTATDTYDAAPTRVTFDGGSNSVTILDGTTKLSDEIDFIFDKTKRHGVHVTTPNRQYLTYAAGNCYYKEGDATDNTMILNPPFLGPAASFQLFDGLEIYGNLEVQTIDLVGYDFNRTLVKYDNTSPYTLREIIILKAGEVLTEDEENPLRDYMDLSWWWSGVLSFHGSLKQNRYIHKTYFGNEIIINGLFDTDTGWIKDPGYSISGGRLVVNAVVAGGVHQTQNLIVGERYRVGFEITEYTSGAIAFLQDYTSYTSRSAVGKYVEDFIYAVGAIPNRTELRTPSGFVGKIDNFSLRKISSL